MLLGHLPGNDGQSCHELVPGLGRFDSRAMRICPYDGLANRCLENASALSDTDLESDDPLDLPPSFLEDFPDGLQQALEDDRELRC